MSDGCMDEWMERGWGGVGMDGRVDGSGGGPMD